MARGTKSKAEGSGGPGERQSLYFPKEMLEEIKTEALRQDRSLSWIIQKAWRVARPKIEQLPSANEMEPGSPPPRRRG